MNAELKSQATPADWLRYELSRIQQKNSRYSLRAFAKTLGIGSGRLSEYISGKRHITVAVAEKIAARLNFDDDLKNAFLERIQASRERKTNTKDMLKMFNSEEITLFFIQPEQLQLAQQMICEFRNQLTQHFSGSQKAEAIGVLQLRLLEVKKTTAI